MPYYAHNQDPQAQAFVRRIYAMRNLGVWLLAFPYVSVLVEQGTLHVYGALVALNVLAWPHLAFWLARRAPNPIRAERRNLVADAALGGFSIAVTQVSLVPAAAMLTILAADRLSAGGWKLLGRAMLAGAIIFVVTAWALGWPVRPYQTTGSGLRRSPGRWPWSSPSSRCSAWPGGAWAANRPEAGSPPCSPSSRCSRRHWPNAC